MNDAAIVDLARRYLKQQASPYQLREVVRLARSFVTDGHSWIEAVELACDLQVRQPPQTPPWAA